VKIKICGLTRVEDAKLASELGAWALGFIFFKGSKRVVGAKQVASILAELPAARGVGVFVNPTIAELKETLRVAPLSMIQLHGNEDEAFCKEVRSLFSNLPVIKARRLRDEHNFETDYTLLDHAEKGEWGGTGKQVDWKEIGSKYPREKLILAGGIHAGNILEANRIVRPFAFDLSSGVESAPGIKSPEKLNELFKIAKQESSS